MSPTTSSTLFPDLGIPLDQTSTIDQHLVVNHPEFGYTVQSRYIPLKNTLSRFRESTSDGGILLRSSFPKLKMTFRFHSGCIITNVPQASLSEELLIKISRRLLGGERTSETTPHLEAVQWIKKATGLSQDRIGRLIGVTRQTINNWENGVPIADINRRRLFAVRDVLERAALRHSTPAQLVAWLDTPRGTDGHTPAELLEMNQINRARLLAVSSPSPHLVRAPAWVKRSVPEAFRTGAERRQMAMPPDSDNELAALIEDEEDNSDEDGEVLPPT